MINKLKKDIMEIEEWYKYVFYFNLVTASTAPTFDSFYGYTFVSILIFKIK